MSVLAAKPPSSDTLPAGTRIACRIEYDGENFNGWQVQPHLGTVTVQGALESALGAVANTAVRVHCAGRTDSGVHAHAQIIHFDMPASRSCRAWVLGGNSTLPRSIRIHWALAVESSFHARFSALSRSYRYVIENTAVHSALLRHHVTWCSRPLDAHLMHAAAQALLGERDFSAFRASSCQASTPMRNVQSISVERWGDLVVIDISANAFLHHMVRNIAGSLIAVGDGRRPQGWIAELIEGRDRTLAAETAPASGLYLADIQYPAQFGLPKTPYGPPVIPLRHD
ncbi:tRNA pseudouridine(38-40) synthase TruA [Halioglobus sp.]|nr:tRNA pseudouridine(38-40) synthase TruA [Halioglobus sp.]